MGQEFLSSSDSAHLIDYPNRLLTRRTLFKFGAGLATTATVNFILPPKPALAYDEYLNLPIFKQDTPTGCARACAAMELLYYGYRIPMISRQLKAVISENACIKDSVCSNGLMESFSRVTDKKLAGTYVKTNQWRWLDTIKAYVRSRNPLITLIPNGRNLKWPFARGHYVVVNGFNDDERLIYYGDPWDGNLWITGYSHFKEAWGSPSYDAQGYQAVAVSRSFLV